MGEQTTSPDGYSSLFIYLFKFSVKDLGLMCCFCLGQVPKALNYNFNTALLDHLMQLDYYIIVTEKYQRYQIPLGYFT